LQALIWINKKQLPLILQQKNTTNSFDSGLGLDTAAAACSKEPIAEISVSVIFGSEKYIVSVSLSENVKEFKKKVYELSGVPCEMQKLICKGLKLVEEKTLQECDVVNNSKVMLIGSRPTDIDSVKKVNKPSPIADVVAAAAKKEPLCRQKQHAKIIDKGIPEDAIPGIKNTKDPLPDFPISGMVNKTGGKVRLTFKLELDQVWIGTKERTEKINMSQIRRVVNEPIENYEQYHILGLQLGPTEQSLYFFYWVPAQYINSIKDAIIGG